MTAIFRCDAASDIGFGHVSRCIALAEAFRQVGVKSKFLGNYAGSAQHLIAAAGFPWEAIAHSLSPEPQDIESLESIIRSTSDGFVVIDSYSADAEYLATVRTLGAPVIVFDDFCDLSNYPCDVVLNFTLSARAYNYPAGLTALLGPEYFPARRKLVELREDSLRRNRGGAIGNVLVAIGGSDPTGIAARILRILGSDYSGITLRVIAKPDSGINPKLPGFAAGSQCLSNLPDLAEQFMWADACIVGGGLTKYEAAFMGVPVATIAQNEGQATETRAWYEAGLVFDLGSAATSSCAMIQERLCGFFAGDDLRQSIIARIHDVFPDDPSVRAADAILAAIRT